MSIEKPQYLWLMKTGPGENLWKMTPNFFCIMTSLCSLMIWYHSTCVAEKTYPSFFDSSTHILHMQAHQSNVMEYQDMMDNWNTMASFNNDVIPQLSTNIGALPSKNDLVLGETPSIGPHGLPLRPVSLLLCCKLHAMPSWTLLLATHRSLYSSPMATKWRLTAIQLWSSTKFCLLQWEKECREWETQMVCRHGPYCIFNHSWPPQSRSSHFQH